MSEKIFTNENAKNLSDICRRTRLLLNETTEDGNLMVSQKMILADLIKEYVNSPIVKYSGIIPTTDEE